MLYQHAAEKPIGRWTRFEERASGLYAYGEILLSTRLGQDAYSLIRARALDGLSLGYQTRQSIAQSAASGGPSAGGGNSVGRRPVKRRITEADLWEVSIVTFPMAPAARITHLGTPKHEAPPPDKAALAGALREAGRILAATA